MITLLICIITVQIKKCIIDNIHYLNFITFNISILFLPWFALLHLYAVKYGNYFNLKKNYFFAQVTNNNGFFFVW